MKRILTVLASIALVASVASAQNDDFNGYWFMQLQGGAAHTIGETSFSKLISPSAAVSLGYQFSPVFGARLNVNGWQGKGAVANGGDGTVYKYNYAEGGLDLMADLASAFAGYKADRLFNPYIFGGVAANYAFGNDEAQTAFKNSGYSTEYLWDNSKLLGALRAGLGVNIRLTDALALNLEGNSSFIGDHFNSKKGSKADFQIKALAGLTFRFGKAKPAPVVVPAPAPAPAPEVKPEPKPVVEEKPVVVEEPAFESLQRNIFFVINKWDIRDSEQLKIDEIVEALKNNPDTKVRVSGYADKATGTAARNKFLSQKRSEIVAQSIKDAGISADRIITEYYGDTVNPFETPEENRVAVCLVK